MPQKTLRTKVVDLIQLYTKRADTLWDNIQACKCQQRCVQCWAREARRSVYLMAADDLRAALEMA